MIGEEVRHQVAIAGQVRDEQTGKLIEGVQIIIAKAPPQFLELLNVKAKQYGDRWPSMVEREDRTRTTTEGHFHFMDLPNGSYTVHATVPDLGSRYSTVSKDVAILRDANGNLKLTAVNLALPPTTIKGQVRGRDSNPVVMAEVKIKGSGERTYTNNQGRYVLTQVEVGSRTIKVSAQGYKDVSTSVVLTRAGTVENMDVNLVPATS